MKHRIILLKAWTNKFGRKYPIGQIIQCDEDLRNTLVDRGTAKDYDGSYPPRGKTKTNFFSPA